MNNNESQDNNNNNVNNIIKSEIIKKDDNPISEIRSDIKSDSQRGNEEIKSHIESIKIEDNNDVKVKEKSNDFPERNPNEEVVINIEPNLNKDKNIIVKKVDDKVEEKIRILDKLIDESGICWFNFKIYIIMALFFFADGGEMIVISLIVKELGEVWDLTEGQKGLMGSCVFIGFLLGALVSGFISDNKGRKPTFILGAIIVSIFGSLSAFSPNYTFLILVRALFGFGVGISVPACSSLCTEVTPLKYRSLVLSLVWLTFPIGEIIAVLIAKLVMNKDNGWRYLLFLVGSPCILSLFLSFFIIESPKFFYTIEKIDPIINCVDIIRYDNNLKKLSDEEKLKLKQDLINEIKENKLLNKVNHKNNDNKNEKRDVNIENTSLKKETKIKNNKSSYQILFSSKYIGLTIKSCFIFFVVSYIYYGIVFILPQSIDHELKLKRNETVKLLDEKINKDLNNTVYFNNNNITTNISNNALLNLDKDLFNNTLIKSKEKEYEELYDELIISTISELPSIVVTTIMTTVSRLGRIKSLIIGFIATSISLLLCIISMNNIGIFAALAKFSINIPFSIIYIYVCEAFPTSLRSTAIGITNAFTRFGGILTPLLSQYFFSIKPSMPYVTYFITSTICIIVSYLLPFETMGKKIE